MTTGIITIAFIVIIKRIIEIYKNKGISDWITEITEGGAHFIVSTIMFGFFNGILTFLS